MKKFNKFSEGFTLIELMVTIAIAAILMMVAVPSFREFLKNNELRSTTNGLYGAFLTARSEAMSKNSRVYVIPYADNDWKSGWKIFVDVDKSGALNSGDAIISEFNDVPANLNFDSNGLGDVTSKYVMYDGSGFSKQNSGAFLAGTLTINRLDNSSFSQVRRLKIASTGKVRVCTPTSSTDAACKSSGVDE